jgi:flagellar FliJ protein
MDPLKTLQLAIEHATRQRDAVAQSAARARLNLGAVNNQMAQLEGYAGETDAKWLAPNCVARSTELIRHHYQFMERLQQAIGMQNGVITSTKFQLDMANKALLAAEFRLAGLEQVLKSRKAVLLKKQQRNEQRQTDEFAAMQHARNNRPSI